MENIRTRICICGAGIAGIMAAYLLGSEGFDIILLEKEDKFNKNGADILKPNAIKILKQIGVYAEILLQGGIERKSVDIYYNGDLLNTFKYENQDIFTLFPCELLVNIFVGKLKNLKNVKCLYNEKITGISFDNDIAILKTENLTIDAEIFIAADGVNSLLVKQSKILIDRFEFPQTIFFGAVPTQRGLEKSSKVYINGNGGFAYFYPINSNNSRVVIGIDDSKIGGMKNIEDLKNELITFVDDSSIEIINHLNKIETLIKVKPISLKSKSFFYKKIIFIGNSVHAVHPLSGYGMNLTIEDVYIAYIELKEYFAGNKSLLESFKSYEKNRIKKSVDFVDYSINLYKSTFNRDNYCEILNINKYKEI